MNENENMTTELTEVKNEKGSTALILAAGALLGSVLTLACKAIISRKRGLNEIPIDEEFNEDFTKIETETTTE